MKTPKDGYYTVYLLPADWYVGYTGDVKTRMRLHTRSSRDISHWVILGEFEDKRDALDVERHYHNRGYNGSQITPEAIFKRVANTDWDRVAVTRNQNTDWTKRNQKIDYDKVNGPKRKVIIQYNKDGSIVQEWESIAAASESLGLHFTAVSNCLRGKCLTTGGYKWGYKP